MGGRGSHGVTKPPPKFEALSPNLPSPNLPASCPRTSPYDPTELSVLESKWRTNFTVGHDPEKLLGRGIINRTTGLHMRQMSHAWIREVRTRLLGSSVPGARRVGLLLDTYGYRGGRYINVLNGLGQSVMHPMP